MMRHYPLLIALPLLLAYGVAEGLWTNRWAPAGEVEHAAARIRQLPLTVGDWEGQEQELDAQTVAEGEFGGHVLRTYIHRGTGARVSVAVVCGRPGPIALHTPDQCYPNSGYEPSAPRARTTYPASASGGGGEFWTADYTEPGPVPVPLRVSWSWNADGEWLAPDNPRVRFAGFAVLYKIYLVREKPPADGKPEDDPGREFLSHFLPEVAKALFPSP